MRAVVRLFLTLLTKSIWKSLPYKKLPVEKFFEKRSVAASRMEHVPECKNDKERK